VRPRTRLGTTRYAAVGDDDVAYQVVGDGPFDLLCCYDLGSQIDLLWQLPPVLAGMFAAFARTIVFDRRGTGASDPVPRVGLATWEEWTEDIGAVLDAALSTRAIIYAENDAGAAAICTRPCILSESARWSSSTPRPDT
jgi:pimeloyl-ACP methyl ester carboxylesterase